MGDSKSGYSSGVGAQKALAQLDASLNQKLERAAVRTAKYHDNWQAVNINTVVERFSPGSVAVLAGSKITFQSPGSNIQVVCDVRGGYCRIKDNLIQSKRCYLDINGKNRAIKYFQMENRQDAAKRSTMPSRIFEL